MISNYFNNVDLWVICLFLITIFSISSEFFFYLGKKISHKPGYINNSESASDLVPTSILGLLALLLGFTFSMAITRYENRKNLILQEANAIGTTYLRADFLPHPQNQEIKKQLKAYVTHRLDFFNHRINSPQEQSYVQKTQDFHTKIWTITREAFKKDKNVASATFIYTLNDMIDLDASRIHASKDKVPPLVIFIIILITVFGLSTLSFINGNHSNRRYSTLLLSLLFALVIILILDLDRPGRGFIQITQEQLISLQRSLNP